ncbi:MAG: hypothetical protein QW812_05860, partial [Thermoplasmataceae archaeon]
MATREPELVSWVNDWVSIIFVMALAISLLLVPFFVLRFLYRLARFSKLTGLIVFGFFIIITSALWYYVQFPAYSSNEWFNALLILFSVIVSGGTVVLPIGMLKDIEKSSA